MRLKISTKPYFYYGFILIILSFFECANADESLSYFVSIKGIQKSLLKDKLLEYSQAQKQVDSPPKSLFALEHRAKKDLPIFLKLLRSEAYFNSKITITSEQQDQETALIFNFKLGQQYHLKSLKIEIDNQNLTSPSAEALQLQLEQPALTTAILDAEQQLLVYAKNKAYAFATLCPRKIVVNHELHDVTVNFCLKTGKKVRLGAVHFIGNNKVEADFLADLITWQSGALYHQQSLNAQRLKLVESRLFSAARLKIATQADAKGLYPVTFELTERLPRSISAGLRLTTDEELFLFRFAWEHRNLWQRGEGVDVELNISMIKSSLETSFRKPAFFSSENTLILDSAFTTEDTDAYESLRAEFSAAIEHQINRKERINAGLAYQFSRITEEEQFTENFNLVSIPVHYSWDFSDNFLEPTSGGRLWVDAQPFLDISSGATFYKQKIRYNHYLSLLDDSDALILAGRLIVGNIWGANIDNIPADLRYFAGGGDTVRGYSFQSLSPKDAEGKLIGGRSLIALSTELRGWITDSIGLVAFVDAGRAYANEYQDFKEALKIGAGLGARYKTPIGALRLDLARPLNKREEDDEFQVYISIGHTF